MERRPRYENRADAGEELAGELAGLRTWRSPVILALPPGGVPVAAPVADRLAAPLDVILVGKIGAPGQPELAIGAVAMIGARSTVFRNAAVLDQLRVDDDQFEALRVEQQREIDRRRTNWGLATPDLTGAEVILIDDGLATGSTMRVAVDAISAAGASMIMVAVPVGARAAVAGIGAAVDAIICPATPEPFSAVGQAYRDFSQVGELEMLSLLASRRRR